MQKFIFLALLVSMSVTANAVTAPIALLVEQCLKINDSSISILNDNNVDAIEFERQFIAINNINDHLNYYRQLPLAPDAREALLQCQLHLADRVSNIVHSHAYQHLIVNLAKSAEPEQQQLAANLIALKHQQLPQAEKAQLHTAQVQIQQALRSQALALHINDTDCEVAQTDNGPQQNGSSEIGSNAIQLTIASYLLRQDDQACRQQVWASYQSRAKPRLTNALERIRQIRQSQAQALDYADYTNLALRDTQLTNVENVMAFLRQQTQSLKFAPWDLGKQLAADDSYHEVALVTSDVISAFFAKLTNVGFAFDQLATDNFRVWYRGRLLGEIFMYEGDINQQHFIRRAVIGQQFGQVALTHTKVIKSMTELMSFSDAFAHTIGGLSRASHHYLTNSNLFKRDEYNIPILWLSYWLQSTYQQQLPLTNREKIASNYRQQLHVFRAKVALNYYSQSQIIDLKKAFYDSFSAQWPHVDDAYYSFNAIATEGPLYYQSLWQHAVSQYLYTNNPLCLTAESLVERLVINEQQIPFLQQLSEIVDSPIDPLSLINRINDAQNNPNQPNHNCVVH